MHFNTKYSTTGALAAGHARHRQGMPGCGHWMRADRGGPMWTRADPSGDTGDTGCRPGDTHRAPAEDFTGFLFLYSLSLPNYAPNTYKGLKMFNDQ